MPDRRFFILDDAAPSSEISRMMCLVVENKYRPFDSYSPSKRVAANSSPHNPADIIKNILPQPITRKVEKDQLKVSKQNGFGATLGSIFGFNESQAQKETVDLKTTELKEYSLQNPKDYFFELMENDLYQPEVKKFLLSAKNRRGYLITGFLATSRALIGRTSGSSSEGDLELTVPVEQALQAAGVPVPPGIVSPKIKDNRATEMVREREIALGENDIIAVSYSPVKIKWVGGKIDIGKGLVAKKHQAAFGDSDEEEDVEDADLSDANTSELDIDIEDEVENEDESDEDDEN